MGSQARARRWWQPVPSWLRSLTLCAPVARAPPDVGEAQHSLGGCLEIRDNKPPKKASNFWGKNMILTDWPCFFFGAFSERNPNLLSDVGSWGRKMVKHQANSADEKQLQAHLKRLGLNNIPGAWPDWPGLSVRTVGRSLRCLGGPGGLAAHSRAAARHWGGEHVHWRWRRAAWFKSPIGWWLLRLIPCYEQFYHHIYIFFYNIWIVEYDAMIIQYELNKINRLLLLLLLLLLFIITIHLSHYFVYLRDPPTAQLSPAQASFQYPEGPGRRGRQHLRALDRLKRESDGMLGVPLDSCMYIYIYIIIMYIYMYAWYMYAYICIYIYILILMKFLLQSWSLANHYITYYDIVVENNHRLPLVGSGTSQQETRNEHWTYVPSKSSKTWVSGVALKIGRDKRWTQHHGLGSPVTD